MTRALVASISQKRLSHTSAPEYEFSPCKHLFLLMRPRSRVHLPISVTLRTWLINTKILVLDLEQWLNRVARDGIYSSIWPWLLQFPTVHPLRNRLAQLSSTPWGSSRWIHPIEYFSALPRILCRASRPYYLWIRHKVILYPASNTFYPSCSFYHFDSVIVTVSPTNLTFYLSFLVLHFLP